MSSLNAGGRATLTELQCHSAESSSGIRLTHGQQVSRQVVDAPLWSRHLNSFELIPDEHLTSPYRIGWRFVAPVLDMATILDLPNSLVQGSGRDFAAKKVGSDSGRSGRWGDSQLCRRRRRKSGARLDGKTSTGAVRRRHQPGRHGVLR